MAIEVDHAGDDAVDHCKVRRRAFSTPRIPSSYSYSVSKLITIDEFGDTRRRRLPDEGKSSRDYKLGDCVGSGWDWDAAVEVLCNCLSEWHVQKVDLGCVIPRWLPHTTKASFFNTIARPYFFCGGDGCWNGSWPISLSMGHGLER